MIVQHFFPYLQYRNRNSTFPIAPNHSTTPCNNKRASTKRRTNRPLITQKPTPDFPARQFSLYTRAQSASTVVYTPSGHIFNDPPGNTRVMLLVVAPPRLHPESQVAEACSARTMDLYSAKSISAASFFLILRRLSRANAA